MLGALNPQRLALGAEADEGNDRIIHDQGASALFFDPDDTGAQAQVLFATLANSAALAASDFVVI